MSQSQAKPESVSSVAHLRIDSPGPDSVAPGHSQRVSRLRTAPPPPPPLAAYSVRSAAHVDATGIEFSAPPPTQEAWSELAPNPAFVALSQAPRPRSRNGWPLAAAGLGAAALLAAGYLAGTARLIHPAAGGGEHIIATQLPAAHRVVTVDHRSQPARTAPSQSPSHDTAQLPTTRLLTSTAPSTRTQEEPTLTAGAAQPSAPAIRVAVVIPSAAIGGEETRQPNVADSANSPASPKPAPVAASVSQQPTTSSASAATEVQTNSATEGAENAAPATTAETPAVASDLPELPTREAVKDSLEQTRAQLTTCAGTLHGTTFANVTIAGSGHATYAMIEGKFAGTPEGSCMARALRSATYPTFSTATFKVRYPFVF